MLFKAQLAILTSRLGDVTSERVSILESSKTSTEHRCSQEDVTYMAPFDNESSIECTGNESKARIKVEKKISPREMEHLDEAHKAKMYHMGREEQERNTREILGDEGKRLCGNVHKVTNMRGTTSGWAF